MKGSRAFRLLWSVRFRRSFTASLERAHARWVERGGFRWRYEPDPRD